MHLCGAQGVIITFSLPVRRRTPCLCPSWSPRLATVTVRGAPQWTWNRMRTLSEAPCVVELPAGHDPREGCAEMGLGPHANTLTNALDGTSSGARTSYRMYAHERGDTMRIRSLVPEMELSLGYVCAARVRVRRDDQSHGLRCA